MVNSARNGRSAAEERKSLLNADGSVHGVHEIDVDVCEFVATPGSGATIIDVLIGRALFRAALTWDPRVGYEGVLPVFRFGVPDVEADGVDLRAGCPLDFCS